MQEKELTFCSSISGYFKATTSVTIHRRLERKMGAKCDIYHRHHQSFGVSTYKLVIALYGVMVVLSLFFKILCGIEDGVSRAN